MKSEVCVLDASVGVKWFRSESGSQDAFDLLARHGRGELLLAVDTLFFYEVLNAANRGRALDAVNRTWADLRLLNLVSVPLDERLVQAAARARTSLGCSLYDGFSAGLADLLDAPLYSGDARAHGRHPRVRLIG